MCGTGSFSLEAAMISNRIPPGWYREFAFFGWPCFRPGRWKHLRKIAREIIQPAEKPLIFASDLDPDATGKLQRIVKEFALDPAVQVECKDFFLPDPAGLAASPGTITLNPPYGVRIKIESSMDKLYAGIGLHLSEHFTGWDLALILPEKKLLRHLPFKVETMAFTHGGLRLILATGRIKNSDP